MVRPVWIAIVVVTLAGRLSAQGVFFTGQEYLGPASVGSNEPLYPYDDQDPWKHGYLQVIPFYGGYHSGRPYNYHHVFSQTQTSVGWGMPHGLPYSQQWWTRFEPLGDPGRAMTEPNGYFGQVAPPLRSQEWAGYSPPAGSWGDPGPYFPTTAVSPVQYQAGSEPQRELSPAPAWRQPLTMP